MDLNDRKQYREVESPKAELYELYVLRTYGRKEIKKELYAQK